MTCKKLEWLYLYNNHLTLVDEDLFNNSPVRRLLIERNPLNIKNLCKLVYNSGCARQTISVLGLDNEQYSSL